MTNADIETLKKLCLLSPQGLHHQLVFTLQKYNMGPGNMSKILKLGNNWIDNREMIKAGDNNYFEHVLTRLDNNTPIKVRLADGTYHTTNIVNKSLNTTLAKM